MGKTVTVLTVVGARPQFVKAAAVSRAFATRSDASERIIHTGQHFDANMSQTFFDELEIPAPAFNLQISGGSHGAMTGRMLAGIENVIVESRPDVVLVYGDTNSTLAGALAASKLHVPIAHVEAGMRSFNRRMPEEINRVVADHLSDLLLCPTISSVDNLAKEGIVRGVHHVGDVMFDATRFAAARAEMHSSILHDLDLAPKSYAVATVHRAENTDDEGRLRRVMDFLEKAAKDHQIILPLHPRTRAALDRFGVRPCGLRFIEPVGYLDMHRLISNATAVLTDSGGLQKEAYFHGVPCTTLRNETEWVETISAGWNRLWTDGSYASRCPIADYGEGDAAELCANMIVKLGQAA